MYAYVHMLAAYTVHAHLCIGCDYIFRCKLTVHICGIRLLCCVHAGAEDVEAGDMEPGGEAEFEEGELAPQAQVILTGCWLTMKEISLLLGTIATTAPLPGTLAWFCFQSFFCLQM